MITDISSKIFLTLRLIGALFRYQLDRLHSWCPPTLFSAWQFDMGRMWKFENPPAAYFAKIYGFTPMKNGLRKQGFPHSGLPCIVQHPLFPVTGR